jgi:monoamine oxidase
MGTVIKVNLIFREAFWEQLHLPSTEGTQSLMDLGFIHSSAEPFPTWWTQIPLRTRMLVGWSGGSTAEALAELDDQLLIEVALLSLCRILGLSKSQVEKQLEIWHVHNWSRDPFTRGAYSYVGVGGLDGPSELARPVESTLFFAGEATNTDGNMGTVHGAICTGMRAAREVVASLPARN